MTPWGGCRGTDSDRWGGSVGGVWRKLTGCFGGGGWRGGASMVKASLFSPCLSPFRGPDQSEPSPPTFLPASPPPGCPAQPEPASGPLPAQNGEATSRGGRGAVPRRGGRGAEAAAGRSRRCRRRGTGLHAGTGIGAGQGAEAAVGGSRRRRRGRSTGLHAGAEMREWGGRA